MASVGSDETTTVEVNEVNGEPAKFVRSLVDTDGILECPIDLDINHMEIIELDPLVWNHFDTPARKLKITNTGYTVILSAKWQQHRRPYLSGGPFKENYIFSQIHFHWGENEIYGSEHSIDGSSMPMELHAVHYKDEYETLESALRRPDGVTVLVYFCKLQNEPNAFIEEIVRNLSVIRTAHSSVRIVPSSLTGVLRCFTEDYFLYWGSIITITNIHSILWLICREPIGVSTKQVAEFRTLNDENNTPILSNIRPRKAREERHIFHVNRSGSLYASLLPLPRNLSTNQMDEAHSV